MPAKRLPRLSPLHIQDPLLRGRLYQEIRRGGDDWTDWEVSLDEVLSPELVSLRNYGTAALKWLVCVASGLDDMRGAMQPGSVLRLPPARWVRDRINHYSMLGAA